MEQPLKSEPVWKMMGWPILMVIVFGALFYLTCSSPDKAPMFATANSLQYATEQVLTEADGMAPMRLLSDGRKDEAVAAAKELIKSRPHDVSALICAGNVLVQAGDAKEGYDYLKKSTALAPGSRWVRLNYARKLALGNRYEEAISEYEALEKTKDVPEEWTEPRLELGRLYIVNHQFDEAAQQLKSALQFDTNNGGARRQLGLAMAASGDAKEGYEDFCKGLSLEQLQGYPNEAKDVMDKSGLSTDVAIENVKGTIQQNPNDTDSKLMLARLYIMAKKGQEANELLDKLEKDPKTNSDPRLHMVLSELAKQLGDEDKAFAEFKQAADLVKQDQG